MSKCGSRVGINAVVYVVLQQQKMREELKLKVVLGGGIWSALAFLGGEVRE